MREIPRTLRVEAVVLRHTDMGEADRLITLYTRELGKVRANAKGIRRLRSRKAGHLQTFTRVALLMARGHDLWIITQAEMIEAYNSICEDLERIGYASYVIELLDRFTYEEGSNPTLYKLLVETMNRIATLDDVVLAVRYYEIHFLDLLGFRPELFHCLDCMKEIKPQDQYFSVELGGVLCPSCGDKANSRPISMKALKILRHLQRSTYTEAARAIMTPAVRTEVESLLQDYWTFLLERNLNSPAFISIVRKQNPGNS
jgi:DNA repair protein RecO (recombination protein O)